MAMHTSARVASLDGLYGRRAPRGDRGHRCALHDEHSLLPERLSGRGRPGRRTASHIALQPGARVGHQAERQRLRLPSEQPADDVPAGQLHGNRVGRSGHEWHRRHQSAAGIHHRAPVHRDLHVSGGRHGGHHVYHDQLHHGRHHHHLDRAQRPREEPMTSTLYRTIRGESGMSLAEILIASVIIAIGLVGLLSAVPVASYGIHEGRNLSTATFLANQRLEQVRNAAWTATPANDCLGTSASSTAAPSSTTCNGATVTTFADETTVAAPYGDYSRTVRITDCGATACSGINNSDLRQVAITVTYTPMTGAGGVTTPKSAIVTMLVAKR